MTIIIIIVSREFKSMYFIRIKPIFEIIIIIIFIIIIIIIIITIIIIKVILISFRINLVNLMVLIY